MKAIFLSNNKIFDYEVIIVGAGIAGISAAKILDNNNISNIVIEANNRVGGRAKKALNHLDIGLILDAHICMKEKLIL